MAWEEREAEKGFSLLLSFSVLLGQRPAAMGRSRGMVEPSMSQPDGRGEVRDEDLAIRMRARTRGRHRPLQAK